MVGALLTMLLILSGCNNQTSSNDKIKIYATNFPYESFAKQIGGKYVDANSIYPAARIYIIMSQHKKKCLILLKVICLYILQMN